MALSKDLEIFYLNDCRRILLQYVEFNNERILLNLGRLSCLLTPSLKYYPLFGLFTTCRKSKGIVWLLPTGILQLVSPYFKVLLMAIK